MHALFKKRDPDQTRENNSELAKVSEGKVLTPQHQDEGEAATSIPAASTPAALPLSQYPKQINRKRVVVMLFLQLAVDIGLPLAIYYAVKPYLGNLWALFLGGVPTFLWVVFQFIRSRKVNVIGSAVVLSFIVSAIIFAVTNNPRDLLLRESFITLLFGLLFGVTLIPIKTKTFELRPLVLQLSVQMFSHIPPVINEVTGEPEHLFISGWRHFPRYRFDVRANTAFWAIILTGEFVAKIIIILSPLTLGKVVVISSISIGVVSCVGSLVSTIWSRFIRLRFQHDLEVYRQENSIETPQREVE